MLATDCVGRRENRELGRRLIRGPGESRGQRGSGGGPEEWGDSGGIQKVEPQGFAEGLCMGCEKGAKWDSEGLGPSGWRGGDGERWGWRLGKQLGQEWGLGPVSDVHWLCEWRRRVS